MNMKKKRRSFEAGHFRKFLLIVDESQEVESALYYVASRIQRSSGSIVMLYVIVPQEFQHWINVRQQQVEEETTKAKALFRLFRRKLNLAGFEGVASEEIIREGAKGEDAQETTAAHLGPVQARERCLDIPLVVHHIPDAP